MYVGMEFGCVGGVWWAWLICSVLTVKSLCNLDVVA